MPSTIQKYFHGHLIIGQKMNTKPPSFRFYLFVVGAIINGNFSLRAESLIVSLGLGVSAIFLFVAAFREWRVSRNMKIEHQQDV